DHRRVVQAGPQAIPVTRLAQCRHASAADQELAPAGQAVPRRLGRVHLPGQVAGDVRGVAAGSPWWAVSQASLGQGGQAASPAEPAAVPAEAGALPDAGAPGETGAPPSAASPPETGASPETGRAAGNRAPRGKGWRGAPAPCPPPRPPPPRRAPARPWGGAPPPPLAPPPGAPPRAVPPPLPPPPPPPHP